MIQPIWPVVESGVLHWRGDATAMSIVGGLPAPLPLSDQLAAALFGDRDELPGQCSLQVSSGFYFDAPEVRPSMNFRWKIR